MNRSALLAFAIGTIATLATPRGALAYDFSTGNTDGRMASGSRPGLGGLLEIESADDFVISAPTSITSASFTGLLTGGGNVGQVGVEIYRVFPTGSQFPPSGRVPTRINSPSDVAFADRGTAGANLSFTTTSMGSFTATNSVLNGIHPAPNQTTGGDGPVTGDETVFNVNFDTPFLLPADHYFFVPQVQVTGGDFYWLSAPKPIVAPGDPFSPDLQSWIRDENLAPDWLRIGTDIVGPANGSPAPAFNATFSLHGVSPVPEPSSLALLLGGLSAAGLGAIAKRRRRPRS
jgi:hypothetical protein